jgi:hypothetical protein
MKLKKITSMAMMAALALGAFSAKASVGTVTNYDKLSISIEVTTNGNSTTSGNVTKYPVHTAKYNTKDLLALFASAHWANTTFPAGAQIVVGWDTEWDGDVLVVDKTGTNVLYDASDESASASDDAYFEVYTEYDGDYTETYNDNAPGFESWDETYAYYVVLYDGLANTDLWSEYSTGTQKFEQKWDASFDYTTWSDSESIDLQMGGDQEVNDNSNGSLIGNVKLSGKGKGVNSYWY